MKKIVVLLLAFFLTTTTCFAEVRVLDGDSIIVDGYEVRLIGIDAPEYKQYCFDNEGNEYNCGEASKVFVKELIKGRKVVCNKIKKDIYKRYLSECFADDLNINLELLKSGWAVLYRSENIEYIEAEKTARKNKLGMWQGRFMKPEFHRLLNKREHKK